MASTHYTTAVQMFQGVPFDDTYQHTLMPASQQEKQHWLILNYEHRVFKNLMFIKINTVNGEGSLRLSVPSDEAEKYNYCAVQDGKGNSYFAFVLGCTYINDGATPGEAVYEFQIKRDLLMTYLVSQDVFTPCPIVRHHSGTGTSEDRYNNLRVAENIPLGEYVHNDWIPLFKEGEGIDAYQYYAVIVFSPKSDQSGVALINKVPQGAIYKIFKLDDVAGMNKEINDLGDPTRIISIYVVPKALYSATVPDGGKIITDPDTISGFAADDLYKGSDGVEKVQTLNGYKPKNSKLLYYPYNMGRLYNDIGNFVELRFEDWGRPFDSYRINTSGCAILPVSFKAYPLNYNGLNFLDRENFDLPYNPNFCVEISNYPLGSWLCDAYQTYIANNGIKQIGGIASIGASALGSFATSAITGSPLPLLSSGMSAVSYGISLAAEHQQMRAKADNTNGNTSNGNADYTNNLKHFSFSHLSIRKDFAEAADEYFTRFGYAQNYTVDTPTPSIRPCFCFIQTGDTCINPKAGKMNTSELRMLNEALTTGVTFWSLTNITSSNIFQYDTLDNGDH